MSNANALELLMLNLVNDEREAAGLEPLRLITLLNEAAEDHSQWMLEADQFSHQGENGSTPTDRMDAAGYPFEGSYMSAENIGWQSARGAEGFEDDVAQIHDGLMSSPGHRANILNPNAEDIGIGIEIGTFSGAGGDYEAVMATQIFGRTEADISAWIDPQTGNDEADPPVTPEDPVEDDMPDTDDQPIDDMDDPVTEGPDTDTPSDDDDVAMDDCPMEDDPVTEDDTNEDDDEVVAESDDPATDDEGQDDPDTDEDQEDDDPYDDGSDADDDAEDDAEIGDDEDEVEPGEDVAENDDDTPVDTPTPGIPLPCDLSQFTVDLSDAFEFRQEGDQLIWETSEEKILAAFQKAFDEWTAMMEQPTPDDMAALMLDDFEVNPGCMMDTEDDHANDWLFSDCA